MGTYGSDENEVLARTRRIETRLTKIGVALNVNMKDDDDVMQVDSTRGSVTIDSMDVSVSAIVRAARRAGLHGKKISVVFGGEVLTTSFQV